MAVTLLAMDLATRIADGLVADAADHVLDDLAEELLKYELLARISSQIATSGAGDPTEGVRGYLIDNTLSHVYPGAAYVAFARQVPADSLDSYRSTHRSQLATDENGLSALRLRPPALGSTYLIVEHGFRISRAPPPIGSDLGEDTGLINAIEKATRRFNSVLRTSEGNGSGLLPPVLISPISSRGPRDGIAFSGVMIVGLDLPALIRAVMSNNRNEWRVRITASPMADEAKSDQNAAVSLIAINQGAEEARWIARKTSLGDHVLALEVSLVDAHTGTLWVRLIPVATFFGCALIAILSVALLRRMRDARLRAEQEAQRSDARFRTLVESSNDWIWEIDRDFRLTYASPAIARLLGHAPESLSRRDIRELAPSDTRHLFFPFELANPRGYNAHEHLLRDSSGVDRLFESSATLILDDRGGIAGLRGIDRDISQQQAVREKLAALNEELVSSMRANLASQLLTGLAHELMQPLAAISSYNQASLRLLSREAPNLEEVLHALRSTASQALLAGEIVKGLRRMVSRAQPQAERVSVPPLLDSAIKLVEHRLHAGQISLRLDTQPELPDVWADRIMLLQAILNLLHNAIDAMADSRTREIELQARRGAHDTVEIHVIDSGPGLSEEVAHRVFEARFTTKPEGMGMGLTISRSIMEALEGRLECSPAEGAGCDFVLKLPSLAPPADRQSGSGESPVTEIVPTSRAA